jgi:phosphoglycerate dehydrogenase-like enzyme
MENRPFPPLRVGVTRDFIGFGRQLIEPVLAEHFPAGGPIAWDYLPEHGPIATPEIIKGFDGILVLQLRFDAAAFAGVRDLKVLARWGVGYDSIDVPACTAADVALCITPNAVRRPVAEASIAYVLALSRRLPLKDRLVRLGRWEDKVASLGVGLQGRTLGTIGAGNIGRDFLRLARPFDFGRTLVFDPYLDEAAAGTLGVERVDLLTLCRESDFICIHCPLSAETRHLVGGPQIRAMKPTAFLINTARGGIIDQAALTLALQESRIAGAALDVFEQEPLPVDDPLTRLENVILAPHSVAWTDQLVRANGVEACRNLRAVLHGERPAALVNPEVWSRPGFQQKLAALPARGRAEPAI